MTGDDVWNEADSEFFMRAAPFIVPDRDSQHRTIAELLGASLRGSIVELCCGDGLLAECILNCHTEAKVVGYDRSEAMLKAARSRLSSFDTRFEARSFDIFDLKDTPWPDEIDAIVSSLALHHLDGGQKAALYQRAFDMLKPGGALIVADIIHPTHKLAYQYAMDHWDQSVMAALGDKTELYDIFERFMSDGWNHFRAPDPEDKPSGLFEQLQWMHEAGFQRPDVFWMKAGHAIFGAYKG